MKGSANPRPPKAAELPQFKIIFDGYFSAPKTLGAKEQFNEIKIITENNSKNSYSSHHYEIVRFQMARVLAKFIHDKFPFPQIAKKETLTIDGAHRNLPEVKDTEQRINVQVLDQDALVIVRLLQDAGAERIALLGMANRNSVGGDPFNGSRAQEEELCCTTDLSASLLQYAKEHGGSVSRDSRGNFRPLYGKNSFGMTDVLYSENTAYFAKDAKNDGYLELKETDRYRLNIITSAGIRFDEDARQHYEILDIRTGERFWMDKDLSIKLYFGIIYNQIRTAIMNNTEVLVLSAFACGAFRNNPEDIATIYHTILSMPEFYGQIEIVFCIFKSDKLNNLEVFQEKFKDPLTVLSEVDAEEVRKLVLAASQFTLPEPQPMPVMPVIPKPTKSIFHQANHYKGNHQYRPPVANHNPGAWDGFSAWPPKKNQGGFQHPAPRQNRPVQTIANASSSAATVVQTVNPPLQPQALHPANHQQSVLNPFAHAQHSQPLAPNGNPVQQPVQHFQNSSQQNLFDDGEFGIYSYGSNGPRYNLVPNNLFGDDEFKFPAFSGEHPVQPQQSNKNPEGQLVSNPALKPKQGARPFSLYNDFTRFEFSDEEGDIFFDDVQEGETGVGTMNLPSTQVSNPQAITSQGVHPQHHPLMPVPSAISNNPHSLYSNPMNPGSEGSQDQGFYYQGVYFPANTKQKSHQEEDDRGGLWQPYPPAPQQLSLVDELRRMANEDMIGDSDLRETVRRRTQEYYDKLRGNVVVGPSGATQISHPKGAVSREINPSLDDAKLNNPSLVSVSPMQSKGSSSSQATQNHTPLSNPNPVPKPPSSIPFYQSFNADVQQQDSSGSDTDTNEKVDKEWKIYMGGVEGESTTPLNQPMRTPPSNNHAVPPSSPCRWPSKRTMCLAGLGVFCTAIVIYEAVKEPKSADEFFNNLKFW